MCASVDHQRRFYGGVLMWIVREVTWCCVLMWLIGVGFMVIYANMDHQRMENGDVSCTALY